MKFSEIKSHLSKFRVGIAGAGGLGSNCAIALARSGVGTLVISDFDIIEESNLNRQYYFTDQIGKLKIVALRENIARVNPDILIITFEEKLNSFNIPEVFKGCDIIIEAFDTSDMKEMLIQAVQLKLPGVPLIIGSGVAGWGNSDSIKCRKIDNTLFVCGDEISEVSEDLPTMGPRVGTVANMQADLAVDILMKMKK
jgi:sulfur carrier protein ThiS adenylyltransferase